MAPLPKNFGIDLLGDEKKEHSLKIKTNVDKNNIIVGNVKAPLKLEKYEDLTLRIFIDKNLVEIFANNKQAVAVEHQYIRKNPNLRIFTNDNDLTISKVQAWKMGNIYK